MTIDKKEEEGDGSQFNYQPQKMHQRILKCAVAILVVIALALLIAVGLYVGAKEETTSTAPDVPVSECKIGVTGWCEWSDWSSCTHSCGEGQKSRLRSCSNEQGVIERRSNAIQCVGDAVEVSPCNEDRCRTGLRVVTETARNLRERLDLEDNLFLDRYAQSVTNNGEKVNVIATGKIGYGIWRLTEGDLDQIFNITGNSR